MMKKTTLILFFFHFFLLKGSSQPPERFNKSIDLGHGLSEWGSGLVVRDSVLYGKGLEFSDTTGSVSPFYASYTLSGDTIWKKILPTPYAYSTGQSGRDLQMTSSGKLVGCGTLSLDTTNYSFDSSKAYLMMLDTNGNFLWKKRYRPSGALGARFQHVRVEPDGDIIASGKTRFNSSFSSHDFYAVKTDPQGNVIWEGTYGGGARDEGVTVTRHGNGYLLTGFSFSFGNWRQGLIVKIDSSGNEKWKKDYGGGDKDAFHFLRKDPSGGYIGIGVHHKPSKDIRNFWWVSFDDSLDVIKSDTFSASPKQDRIRLSPIVEDDGSVLFGGDFEDTSRSDATTGVLMKVDSTGKLLWERNYVMYGDDDNHHYLTTLKKAPDSGYYLYGIHTDFYDQGQGGQNLWLLKVDSMGCDTVGCAENTGIVQRPSPEQEALKLFPSPVKKHLQVKRSSKSTESASYRVYDAKGRVVKEGRLSAKRSSLSVGSLRSGVHVLSVRTEKGRVRKRFVKE